MRDMYASARLEDYLEAIFSFEISGEKPTVTAIATELGLTKGTVTTGIKKLAKAMMLEHEPYGAVHLTEAGRHRALKIYRRHENISFLFSELLGIDRKKAEHLACIMEHEMDEVAEKRLFALGDFFCRSRRNCEDWVNRLEKELKDDFSLPKPLAMISKGEKAVVLRLSCIGPLKMKLLEMGLVPETSVVMEGAAPLGDPLLVNVRGMELSLRKREAATIWVRPLH